MGHEVFKGSAVPGIRPQVLVDRRKDTHIMAMFKPSGWATCSTPQWEGSRVMILAASSDGGLEGNMIRYVWRYYDAPTAAPCHRLDKGTSGIVAPCMKTHIVSFWTPSWWPRTRSRPSISAGVLSCSQRELRPADPEQDLGETVRESSSGTAFRARLGGSLPRLGDAWHGRLLCAAGIEQSR